MTINDFKIRLHETLNGFIDTYFGEQTMADKFINSTMKILVKTNINKFDNILGMFADEHGNINANEIIEEYSRQLGGDGIRIDRREYIHNDFIRGLMPEKILLVKKEDFQRMIQ